MDDRSIALIFGLLVPFLGTAAGSALVLFMRREMGGRLQKALLGFAAGVMVAASVWSLLIPSMDMADAQGVVAWVPAVTGLLAGMGALLLVDSLLPHLHLDSDVPEGRPSGLKRPTMLFFAVAIHNLPEGMAVGVVLAGYLAGDGGITLAAVCALAVGIAVQNFPEGAIVSMPMAASSSKGKAFGYGVASGAIEPLGALLMLAVTAVAEPLLPYVLGFAAGAMLYVVVEELIPETQSGAHTNIGTVGVGLGFALMMMLDVALG